MTSIESGTCDNVMFSTNPNFCMKEKILEKDAECLGGSCNFEVYYSRKDKLMSIFVADLNTHIINMISLLDYKIIRTLEGHKDRILNLRYFSIQKKDLEEEEYLVSADRKSMVIIWDLNKDFKPLKKINAEYNNFIYSCLLFMIENNIYIVTSSIGKEKTPTKIFNLKGKKPIKEIKVTTNIYYLIHWHNSKNDEENDYVIQCGKNEILINKLLKGEQYALFNTNKNGIYNLGGFAYTKGENDYLMVSSTRGDVNIWNLLKKIHLKTIKFGNACLFNLVRWNENCMIILNSSYKQLEIIDLNNFEVISEVYCSEFDREKYIKKAIHPLYGECLISISPGYTLKLWSTRNVTFI